MARNQVVMPGFAAFHVGIQTDEAPVEASDVGDDALAGGADTPGEDAAYIDGISE
jgi:hypothetical protein